MCHEAILSVSTAASPSSVRSALCNSFQHRPGLKDESRENYSAKVGAGPKLRYDMGEDCNKASVSYLLRM